MSGLAASQRESSLNAKERKNLREIGATTYNAMVPSACWGYPGRGQYAVYRDTHSASDVKYKEV